jgi:hypothetical protein
MKCRLLWSVELSLFLGALAGCEVSSRSPVQPNATAPPTAMIATIAVQLPTATEPEGLISPTETVDLFRRNPVPALWLAPPVFPGAEQVKTTKFDAPGETVSSNQGYYLYHRQSITFTAPSTAEAVTSFYEEALPWSQSPWGRAVENAAVESFNWSDGAEIAPSVYFIDVITTAGRPGETRVEISSSMFPGY